MKGNNRVIDRDTREAQAIIDVWEETAECFYCGVRPGTYFDSMARHLAFKHHVRIEYGPGNRERLLANLALLAPAGGKIAERPE
jgi:hypothetical protein